MKALLDTSTIIAAMLTDHADHTPAQCWLAEGKSGSFEYYVSSHSCAEVYAVLTRLPRKPPISADDAWCLLHENIFSYAHLVELTSDDYVTLIEQAAKNDVTGGAVYDAIIATAAQKVVVDQLVTLNVADFERVWPDHTGRVCSPKNVAPP